MIRSYKNRKKFADGSEALHTVPEAGISPVYNSSSIGNQNAVQHLWTVIKSSFAIKKRDISKVAQETDRTFFDWDSSVLDANLLVSNAISNFIPLSRSLDAFPSRTKLLDILNQHMPDYAGVTDPHALVLTRIKGALTNCIFAVTVTDAQKYHPKPRKVLLRIYGQGTEDLFSREIELFWFQVLSDLRVGPRLWAQFANGRAEELLESETLTAERIREPQTSAWIAEKFAEVHSLGRILGTKLPPEYRHVLVWERIQMWSSKALAALPHIKHEDQEVLKQLKRYIDRFQEGTEKGQGESEANWLQRLLEARGGSNIVFCHNDAQYGNILHLSHPEASKSTSFSAASSGINPILFIDYEYAGFNSRGYDLGNHFCEWMADYHCATQPHILRRHCFPTFQEREHFLEAYLKAQDRLSGKIVAQKTRTQELIDLHRESTDFVLVSHIYWGLWAVIQARNSEIEFDYCRYALQRFEHYDSWKTELFGNSLRIDVAEIA